MTTLTAVDTERRVRVGPPAVEEVGRGDAARAKEGPHEVPERVLERLRELRERHLAHLDHHDAHDRETEGEPGEDVASARVGRPERRSDADEEERYGGHEVALADRPAS